LIIVTKATAAQPRCALVDISRTLVKAIRYAVTIEIVFRNTTAAHAHEYLVTVIRARICIVADAIIVGVLVCSKASIGLPIIVPFRAPSLGESWWCCT
jgi:hypothetical protein